MNYASKTGRIRQIAEVEQEIHILLMRIPIEMVYPTSIEGGGSTFDAVDLVPLVQ